jgi:FkbM family methyltransferase
MTYKRNKLKTAWEITRRIENWPTAFGLRLRQSRPGLKLLNFRSGLNIVCRRGTQDWDVVHELFFAGGYGRAMEFLKQQSGQPLVLDLGGNIGLFSLLAARTHPEARMVAYEPGPPNYRLFEMNLLANPGLANRIQLQRAAVGGRTREVEWTFDEHNPGRSGLFANGRSKFAVQIRSLTEVLNQLPGPVSLIKMDIEGGEYEVMAETPPETWRQVQALSLELHDDLGQKISSKDLLAQWKSYGFKVEEESVVSYFLYR